MAKTGVLLLWAAWAATSSYILNAATVAPYPYHHRKCWFVVSGELDTNTPHQLKRQLSAAEKTCSWIAVWLDSPGGDLQAALNIGEQIRASRGWTMVGPDASCASACVIAFLGGVQRVVSGKIGLHRPFPATPSDSGEQARGKRERINQVLREYLTKMNIPIRLLDEMNSVSPGTMRWIDGEDNDEELRQLHIEGEDPIYADERDSNIAKRKGISLKELYVRQQRKEILCRRVPDDPNPDTIDAYLECVEDVMDGRIR